MKLFLLALAGAGGFVLAGLEGWRKAELFASLPTATSQECEAET